MRISARYLTMLACCVGLFPVAVAQSAKSRRLEPLHNHPWIKKKDYPDEARLLNQWGVVGYSLQIGTDGRPTQCTVTSSSSSPSLDTATCNALMQRARFRPGRDGQGKPLGGSYFGKVTWAQPAVALP